MKETFTVLNQMVVGTEFDRLRDFVGGDKRALELYQSFRDP